MLRLFIIAALVLLPLSLLPPGCRGVANTEKETDMSSEVGVPALDTAAPAVVGTATFALG